MRRLKAIVKITSAKGRSIRYVKSKYRSECGLRFRFTFNIREACLLLRSEMRFLKSQIDPASKVERIPPLEIMAGSEKSIVEMIELIRNPEQKGFIGRIPPKKRLIASELSMGELLKSLNGSAQYDLFEDRGGRSHGS